MCGQQEKSWWRWIYQRSKNGQKGGVESCEVNRWEDRAELFPPLRPCSPHRHLHMTTTWRSLSGEALTPQMKIIIIILQKHNKNNNNRASYLHHHCCFWHSAAPFCAFIQPLGLCAAVSSAVPVVSLLSVCAACNDWERNAAGFIYPSKNNSPPHCLVGPDWQPPAANSVPAPLEAPPLPRVSAPP